MKIFKLSTALFMILIARVTVSSAAEVNEAGQQVVITDVKYKGHPIAFPQVREKDIDSNLDLVCGLFGYSKMRTMKVDSFPQYGNMPTYALVSKNGVEIDSASLAVPYFLTEITCVK